MEFQDGPEDSSPEQQSDIYPLSSTVHHTSKYTEVSTDILKDISSISHDNNETFVGEKIATSFSVQFLEGNPAYRIVSDTACCETVIQPLGEPIKSEQHQLQNFPQYSEHSNYHSRRDSSTFQHPIVPLETSKCEETATQAENKSLLADLVSQYPTLSLNRESFNITAKQFPIVSVGAELRKETFTPSQIFSLNLPQKDSCSEILQESETSQVIYFTCMHIMQVK